MSASETELRTVEEQAAIWRCGKDSVLDSIRSGELVASKIAGRWVIDPADAKAFMEARKNRVPTVRRVRRPKRRVA